MVVGFDAHHGGGLSVGALVASVTPTLGTYFSTVIRQEPGMDISSGIGAAFESKKDKLILKC